MRATLRRMIAILDGTPTRARGQSLVELTLTLPILMVMLLGLTEIGWYANNYLTLLDVVREAGRFGSTRDPMEWLNGEEKKYSRRDCEAINETYNLVDGDNITTYPGPDMSAYGFQPYTADQPIGYYDGVACSVIRNMPPLVFNNETDDVVVSVFQFGVINRADPNLRQVKVVGRLPAQANECQNDDTYDPFDWRVHNDTPTDPGEDSTLYDPEWDDMRGFCFRCTHEMDFGGWRTCRGSEFSTAEVEAMLNFEGDPDQQRKLEQVPNFGLVLVEVFWTHHQLLGLPWYNLGPLEEGQLIHVWTFFPVSGAEPDIDLE